MFDEMLDELMNYYKNEDGAYSDMLEGAYVYKECDDVARLVLVYNGWDGVLQKDSVDGVCHYDFHEATGIYLVSYAMKLEDFEVDETSPFMYKGKVRILFDKNGMFRNVPGATSNCEKPAQRQLTEK